MEGVEIFFLTDNSVAEALYYRGKSRKKDIFELMLQLVYLELRGCLILQIIWVAGTRKISAGKHMFSKGLFQVDIGVRTHARTHARTHKFNTE